MLNLFERVYGLDLFEGLDLFVRRFESLSWNHVSKELDLVPSPIAFIRRDAEPVIAQPLQHLKDDFIMFIACFGVGDDVIHKSDHTFVEHVLKDVIYHPLECRSGID